MKSITREQQDPFGTADDADRNNASIFDNQMTNDDLECAAIFAVADGVPRIIPLLGKIKHDRPQEYTPLGWLTYECTVDRAWDEGSGQYAGLSRDREELKARVRCVVGDGGWKVLENLRYTHLDLCSWSELVNLGLPGIQASWFLLNTRHACDHVVLTPRMLAWARDNQYESRVLEIPVNTPDDDHYPGVERMVRRLQKSVFPWATSRQVDFIVHTLYSGHMAAS